MRLTKYELRENSMFPYQLKDDELRTRLDAIHKLGQLEDIEEELSIDLLTLFKALKDGFVDCLNEYHHFSNLYFSDEEIFDGYTHQSYYIKDYGKTWALTKEELE